MVILTEGWIPTRRRHIWEVEEGEKESRHIRARRAERATGVGRLKEATRRRKKGARQKKRRRRRRKATISPSSKGSACARVCPTKTRQRGTTEYTHYRTLFSLFPSHVALVLIIMHFVQRCADGDAVGVRPADLRHCVAAVRSVVACIDSGYTALYTVTSAAFPIMSGTIGLVFDTTRLMK